MLGPDEGTSRARLRDAGVSEDYLQAQLQARRWQEWGPHAIVCHNGLLTRRQRLRAAAITVGDKGGLATLRRWSCTASVASTTLPMAACTWCTRGRAPCRQCRIWWCTRAGVSFQVI